MSNKVKNSFNRSFINFVKNYPCWQDQSCCRACPDADPIGIGRCRISIPSATFLVSRSPIVWECSPKNDRQMRFGPGRMCSSKCEAKFHRQDGPSLTQSSKRCRPKNWFQFKKSCLKCHSVVRRLCYV